MTAPTKETTTSGRPAAAASGHGVPVGARKTPDVLWMLGAEGVQVFDGLESSLPAQAPSRLLRPPVDPADGLDAARTARAEPSTVVREPAADPRQRELDI